MHTGSTGALSSTAGPCQASTQREIAFCPLKQSSGKKFGKLLTQKQQSGMQDPAMVH